MRIASNATAALGAVSWALPGPAVGGSLDAAAFVASLSPPPLGPEPGALQPWPLALPASARQASQSESPPVLTSCRPSRPCLPARSCLYLPKYASCRRTPHAARASRGSIPCRPSDEHVAGELSCCTACCL